MHWQHLLLLVCWVYLAESLESRESFGEVTCETGRPEGCTPDLPADCAAERTQRWLPQSNIGVPAACGACYYCKSSPTLVQRETCPTQICPVISPLCNEIKPIIIDQDDRKCRGCSECISYNNCPRLDCPRRIRGCEVYAPNYRYINGELCPDCRVCNRYKGEESRPPSTPLPCPKFNISSCPLVSKCERYEERHLFMGEGRVCQVCPKCLVWADRNELIPSFTLGSRGSTQVIERCDETECRIQEDCASTEGVYRLQNGTTCRDCDRCTSFNSRRAEPNGGNDQPSTASVQSAQQTCPDLSRCPQIDTCNRAVVNKTIRIASNEVCPGCAVCRGRASDCPIVRCPGPWCQQTAIFTSSVNGSMCAVCVCTDPVQDCSSVTCPQTNCSQTIAGSEIIGDQICDCPVCRNDTRVRAGLDGGADLADPDERQGGLPVTATTSVINSNSNALPSVVFSSATTNTPPPSSTTTPNCEQIVAGIVCPAVHCSLVTANVLNIDGTECYGCPRCANQLAGGSTCPTFTCESIYCGDSEDLAAGRRYRETRMYNVSGEVCRGCDVCLDCPVQRCEPLHPQCLRYTRRTDRRGCVLCAYCEIWDGNAGPPLTNRLGFIQSISTASCIESKGLLTDNEPGLVADICEFDIGEISRQKQVWGFSASGLMQDKNTGLCVSHYSQLRPLVMRLCNVANPNMIWTLQKDHTYPQFFRLRHGRTSSCLDIAAQTEATDAAAVLTLSDCKQLGRVNGVNGVWSGQWWSFVEHSAGSAHRNTE